MPWFIERRLNNIFALCVIGRALKRGGINVG